MLLGISVALLLTSIAAEAIAAPVVFPSNSGYVNLRTTYGAHGDGVTDDTEAFRAAVKDNVRSLYLPKGTYLLVLQR